MAYIIALLLSFVVTGCGTQFGDIPSSHAKHITDTRSIHVQFDKHQSNLTPEHKKAITQFIGKNYHGQMIRLIGHSENGGSSQYNYILSYQRAEAVKEHLKIINISPGKIDTKGYGTSRSQAPGSILFNNRFVEINLVEETNEEEI